MWDRLFGVLCSVGKAWLDPRLSIVKFGDFWEVSISGGVAGEVLQNFFTDQKIITKRPKASWCFLLMNTVCRLSDEIGKVGIVQFDLYRFSVQLGEDVIDGLGLCQVGHNFPIVQSHLVHIPR